ncbi:transposase, partial [Longibaculum muris]|uniref:transposase n=1 Tax=Longibaculum muris TaxID=1796628 RepID=UPI0022DEC258
TDPDATFMHMKYDYYNHTNVFKPGYNIQFGISDGNDLKTYIPFMKKYKEAYGKLPKRTPADAGYGSYDNYSYCKENNIELYMKYSGYYKEREKATQKNQFKLIHFKRDEKNQFVCPAGHTFELEKETIDRQGEYERINKHYVNRHCEGCPLRSKCTKAKNGRTLVRCDKLEEYHQEARSNVTSDEGIKLMKKRSNESEGTFGDLKYNQKYDRLRRRGEAGVKLEIYLIAIGENLRKYHRNKMKEKEKKQIN